MDEDSRARFERIEATLERVGGRLESLTVAHSELEAAQKNLTALMNRNHQEFDERTRALDERLTKTKGQTT